MSNALNDNLQAVDWFEMTVYLQAVDGFEMTYMYIYKQTTV